MSSGNSYPYLPQLHHLGTGIIFEYAYALLWRNLSQSIEHDLRLDAYEHLQSLELAYFEDRSTGD
jgi:ATP-binding cassette subfamily B protein